MNNITPEQKLQGQHALFVLLSIVIGLIAALGQLLYKIGLSISAMCRDGSETLTVKVKAIEHEMKGTQKNV